MYSNVILYIVALHWYKYTHNYIYRKWVVMIKKSNFCYILPSSPNGLFSHSKSHISQKSCHNEIILQGSVWCGNNSRVVRFRGWHLQRSTRTEFHNKINYGPIWMNICACTYMYRGQPLTMWQHFKGGIYWDNLAETCSDISRAAGFWGAATFRGNTVIGLH